MDDKFWRFWLEKFEFLLAYAYYDVKVLSNRNNYYSNVASIAQAPKRRLINLIRKKNQLDELNDKMLTTISYHELSTCLSDERRLSYTFDETIIQKVVELLAENEVDFSWETDSQNEFLETNVASNAVVVANKIYRSDFKMNITMKNFMEKLYNSLQKFNNNYGNQQKTKSVTPRNSRRKKKYRLRCNKQRSILSLEELDLNSSNNK